MKKLFFLPFFFLSLVLFWGPHSELRAATLKEAIQITVSNNNSLKATEIKLKKAQEALDVSEKKLLPYLNFDSSFKYVNETASLTLPLVPPRTVSLGTKETYDAGLTLGWVVFNGFGKETQVNMAKINTEASKIQLQKMQKIIAYQTINIYFNILSLSLQKQILEAGRDRVKLQHEKVKIWEKNGLVLPIEAMSIAVFLSQYEQKLTAIKAGITSLNEQLTNLIGQNIEIATPNNQISELSPVELDLTQNEDFLLLTKQKDLAYESKNMAQSQNWPTVALTISGRYGKPGVNPINNDWMSYAVGQVGISGNLWDWGQKQGEAQIWDEEIAALNYQEKTLKEQIKLTYDNAKRELSTMTEQKDQLLYTMGVASKKMKILQEQAQNGIVSAADFRDAENDLLQAELALRQQELAILLKGIELDYLSGAPIEKWRL
jgi:outer membrane protein TolC